MVDKIGQDERKKSRPRPPAAGKGRRAGSKNKISKATLPGLLAAAGARNERHEDIRAISRDILGLDSLARTGKISSNGVAVRQYCADVIAGTKKISPERVALIRLFMAYGYGTPDKMKPEESKKRSLVFIAEGGLPWENDPMKDQEARAIAAQQAQDKIEAAAAERKLQGLEPDDPDDDEDPDALELVR